MVNGNKRQSLFSNPLVLLLVGMGVALIAVVLAVLVLQPGELLKSAAYSSPSSSSTTSAPVIQLPGAIQAAEEMASLLQATSSPIASIIPTPVLCTCSCEPNLCFHTYGLGIPFGYKNCHVWEVPQVAINDCDSLDGRLCAGWKEGNILPTFGRADCEDL